MMAGSLVPCHESCHEYQLITVDIICKGLIAMDRVEWI